jgi:hypothetical protein
MCLTIHPGADRMMSLSTVFCKISMLSGHGQAGSQMYRRQKRVGISIVFYVYILLHIALHKSTVLQSACFDARHSHDGIIPIDLPSPPSGRVSIMNTAEAAAEESSTLAFHSSSTSVSSACFCFLACLSSRSNSALFRLFLARVISTDSIFASFSTFFNSSTDS